jgi:hypothetical protein
MTEPPKTELQTKTNDRRILHVMAGVPESGSQRRIQVDDDPRPPTTAITTKA